MKVPVNGVRLFFDVGGLGVKIWGPDLSERRTLIVPHGAPEGGGMVTAV